MEGLGTYVRWSQLPILAWVSEKAWWQTGQHFMLSQIPSCAFYHPPGNVCLFVGFLSHFPQWDEGR